MKDGTLGFSLGFTTSFCTMTPFNSQKNPMLWAGMIPVCQVGYWGTERLGDQSKAT